MQPTLKELFAKKRKQPSEAASALTSASSKPQQKNVAASSASSATSTADVATISRHSGSASSGSLSAEHRGAAPPRNHALVDRTATGFLHREHAHRWLRRSWSQLHRRPLNFVFADSLTHQNYVSALGFDSVGALLAGSSTVGLVQIYDFDLALSQTRVFTRNLPRTEIAVDGARDGGSDLDGDADMRTAAASEELKFSPDPVCTIDAGAAVDNLRWHPIQQNQIALCSSTSKSVLLCVALSVRVLFLTVRIAGRYDLQQASSSSINEPTQLLKLPLKMAADGVHDLCFHQGSKDLLTAGCRSGLVRASDFLLLCLFALLLTDQLMSFDLRTARPISSGIPPSGTAPICSCHVSS